jgi:hypothetical protein
LNRFQQRLKNISINVNAQFGKGVEEVTRNELIEKYARKCNEARVKKDELRRSKYKNKAENNLEEAHWDELEQSAYAREFYLAEEILNDLKQMS